MDRTELLRHFREHGARATYLASSCDVTLPTGEKACLVYVFPKYKLKLATERASDVTSALKLALATTVTEASSSRSFLF